MMFWLRSAFCLSLVFSWMPLERSEMARALNDAQVSVAAHEEAAAKIGCGDSALACGAVLLAASRAGAAAGLERPTPRDSSIKDLKASSERSAVAKITDPRPSANTLTAADLGPRWRGRKAKSGV
jgi:hypothetical protein